MPCPHLPTLLFIALEFRNRLLRPGTAQPEEDEVIEIKFFPLGTALRMVMNGHIHDGKTISGVLWLSQK
ncbi:MAG: hypothetical protein WBV46_02465, partial [Terriglobales bacterium]